MKNLMPLSSTGLWEGDHYPASHFSSWVRKATAGVGMTLPAPHQPQGGDSCHQGRFQHFSEMRVLPINTLPHSHCSGP